MLCSVLFFDLELTVKNISLHESTRRLDQFIDFVIDPLNKFDDELFVSSKANCFVLDGTGYAKLSFHVTIYNMVCKMPIIKKMRYYLNSKLLQHPARFSCLCGDNNKPYY